MDVEHLDVVLGAKIAGLKLGLAQADAAVAKTSTAFRELTATADGAAAKVGAASATMGAGLGKSVAAAEPHIRRVGSALTRYVTLPALAVGAAAVKLGNDFGKNMALVESSAGASAGEVDRLRGPVLALARASQFGPVELAKGLYHVESLGYRGAKAMNALKAANAGATAGQANLEATTSALGAAIRSGIRGATDFHDTMAQLTGIVGAGNMRMDDLVGALGTGVLPVARNAGIQLRDVGAALALMTDEGMGADEAATRLKMTFALLGSPSGPAVKAFRAIGLGPLDLAHAMRGPDGLLGALELLKTHLAQLKDPSERAAVLTKAFGGGRSSAAIQLLLNQLGLFKTKQDQIAESARNFDQNVAAQQAQAAYKLHAAWSRVQVDLVKLGATLAPVAVKIASAVSRIVDWFTRLPNVAKTAIGVMVALFAVGGPLLLGVAAVVRALKTINEVIRLMPLTAGPAVATTNAELATIGGAATVAEGKVSMLRLALSRLAGPLALLTAALTLKSWADSDLKNADHGHFNATFAGGQKYSTVGPFKENGRVVYRRVGSDGFLGGEVMPKKGELVHDPKSPSNESFYNYAGKAPPKPLAISGSPFGSSAKQLTDGLMATADKGIGVFNKAAAAYAKLHPGDKSLPKNFFDGGGGNGKAFEPVPAAVQLELAQARTDMAKRKALGDELIALNNELAGKLSTANRIAVEQEKTSALQALDELGKAEVQKRKENAAALVKAQQAATQKREERILGLGPGGMATTPGAQALISRERKLLLAALKTHGVDVDALTHASLAKLVSTTKRTLGDELPKSTLTSLMKINQVLKEKFLPEDVRANIRARLQQIEDTVKASSNRIASTYHAVHTTDLVAGLGLDRDQTLKLRERLARAEAHGMKVPGGLSAAGVPLTAAGTPSVTVHGGITIHAPNLTGMSPAELKKLAEMIQAELLKVGRRNPVQTRGPTAGRSAGLG